MAVGWWNAVVVGGGLPTAEPVGAGSAGGRPSPGFSTVAGGDGGAVRTDRRPHAARAPGRSH